MTRRATAVMTAIILTVSLIPTQHAVSSPTQSITYTQHYTCIISPMPPDPSGVWTQLCNGSWVGWGDRPWTSCTYSDEEVFEECD